MAGAIVRAISRRLARRSIRAGPGGFHGDRAMSGYVQLPEGWERVASAGPGAFVTTEEFRRPDGSRVRWESRRHRKRSAARRTATPPETADGQAPVPGAEPPGWWRPKQRSWWMAVLFVIGSACFIAGGIASQWASTPRPAIGVTFFVGSIFFTTAAYLQWSEAVNAERRIAVARHRRRWRPASWEPRRIDWLSAAVQLIGTFLFNVSTFAALNHSLTTHQSNTRVWAPDAFGSIAFLISSELAFAEVCHRWLCLRCRTLAWKIVALNLLGSIAFGISAIASLLEPSTGEPVSARIANSGTWLGGVGFLIGALLLIPEAAGEGSGADAQTVADPGIGAHPRG